MASLNDYKYYENRYRRRGHGLRFSGFWLQLGLSVVLVAAVAAFVSTNSLPGQAARYLAGEALSAESSWFTFGREQKALPASAELPPPDYDSAVAVSAPKFVAPASGVVVKDLVLDEDGFSSEQGVIIQGMAGQNVRAAAAGEVNYLGESASGFIVEIKHEAGFSSVYQGLSELSISAGQDVPAGDILGLTESGELLFSLFLNGQEVDPLVYLFQQQV